MDDEEIGSSSGVGRFVVLVIALGILLAGTFILGGLYSCHEGGGTLDGLSCVEIVVVDTCENLETGQLLKVNRVPVDSVGE